MCSVHVLHTNAGPQITCCNQIAIANCLHLVHSMLVHQLVKGVIEVCQLQAQPLSAP